MTVSDPIPTGRRTTTVIRLVFLSSLLLSIFFLMHTNPSLLDTTAWLPQNWGFLPEAITAATAPQSTQVSTNENSFTSLPPPAAVSIPPFGSCERTIASYFLQADYGYSQQSMLREQRERDADLVEHPVGTIFNTQNGLFMSRRWPGVHFNPSLILEYAQRVVKPLREEWSQFPESKAQAKNPKTDYFRNNGMYDFSDPIVLHSFVRAFKPSRVLEIGSGFSSRITTAALALNEQECGGQAEFTVIDPALSRMARNKDGVILGPTDVHNSWLEDEQIDFFTSYLGPGDLFFVDSSHALGFGGSGNAGVFFADVMEEYSEILPRLTPGVFVHIHDIPWPDHYWFKERNWAEQFVVQAFFSNNPYFDIVWFGGALTLPGKDKELVEEQIQQAMDAFGPYLFLRDVGKQAHFGGGGSLWVRRNTRPYEHSMDYPKGVTVSDVLKSPKRSLTGVAGVSADSQTPRLQQVMQQSGSSTCPDTSTCVTCAFLVAAATTAAAAGGGGDTTVLAYGVDDLVCPQDDMEQSIQRLPRSSLLTTPLKTFLDLKRGDAVVLGGVQDLDSKRQGEFVTGTVLVTEIAPRLASGVLVVLMDGVPGYVADIVQQKQNTKAGNFVAQAWMTMNDAWEVLWTEDSGSAQAARVGGDDSHNHHTIILRRQ